METKEIMAVETDEIAEIIAEPTRSLNGLKVVGVVVVVVVIGGVAYKYVVKPTWLKIKALRAQRIAEEGHDKLEK